ncbi:uncharacterized protein B0J16DRAFT_358415 [Fusarium flagelliforme]|uniref:uncharacterized protein n=1 Tax=Fusarium flagelliforme TaxID=2675880 RepID=UPI001E8D5728|nr:uncharacterized protein B0J16DRAFT_358415 [Fusarium flagelliforme]KAH7173121.1 hypothetical protein B0J16DRAFT_358415 [Fusarium flagelliforme]
MKLREPVLVPYTENPDFVHRPEIFEKLQSQLGFSQRLATANTQLRVSLYRLGGERPDVSVFWVHASNEERFRQSYALIAEECNIPGRDDPKVDVLVLVRDWLTKRFKTQWLIVINNAEDTQLFFQLQQENADPTHEKLGRYIPKCAHRSILATTRNRQAGLRLARGKPPIEVDNMTSHKTYKLVRTMLENNDIPNNEISSLATRLENLPLALAQAASFIHENGITIDKYIMLLDKSDTTFVECLSKPFKTVGRDSETPHAVTATWIISLFDQQAIPREFITSYWQRERVVEANESSQEVRIMKALGTLKAFCFISEAKDQSLDMHRKGKMSKFAQHALETVSDKYPYGKFETQEVCLKYLPHAYAVLENESTDLLERKEVRVCLLHHMAGYFDYKGHWKEAKQYQIGAVKLRTEVLGEDHPHQEAKELQVDVMAIRKRVLGEEHPDTLKSMANLAITWKNNGRSEDGLSLMQCCIVLQQKVLMGQYKSFAIGAESEYLLL